MPDSATPATTRDAVRVSKLVRTFGVRGKPDRVALGGVDLQLTAGQVHGLLGPNGAGKTTICRIVSTVLLPTSGVAEVLGHDVVRQAAEVRRLIGIVFGGERGLYGRLTAAENLRFWCSMYGLGKRQGRLRSDELLQRMGLGARADTKVETFSRGMKQRLHLARGLVSDPPVLILDEPTVGMDPIAAHDFRRLVSELHHEGRTILLTTHDMAEAEAVCDSVTFIDNGTVLGSGTPSTVRTLVAGGHRIRVHNVDPEAAATLRELIRPLGEVGVSYDDRTRNVDIVVAADRDLTGAVMSAVLAAGHSSVSAAPPTLEDVYLGLLGSDDDGGQRGMGIR